MFDKVYVDMDGVLCDFEKRFHEVTGVHCHTADSEANWPTYWQKFIDGKNFETLEWYPGGEQLIKSLLAVGYDIEILSSAGGSENYEDVNAQKIKWLKDHGIDVPANIVVSGNAKGNFATKDCILIDDTEHVIQFFKDAGGQTILHTNTVDTLSQLLKLTNKEIERQAEESITS